MKNKKTIMTFSAFSILIFHLWIYVTHYQIERYIRQICVIGVDLFFFISAYSIFKIKPIEYKSFIIDRFKKIYLKFIVFAMIGWIYFKWNLFQFIQIVLGIDLLIRGGGSFLWFLPSIMIIYLLLPFYKKVDLKHPKTVPIITFLLYFLLSIGISLFTNYHALFILINRIPIILFGYYLAKYHILEKLNRDKIKYWITTLILLLFGIVISYFEYTNHFKVVWFKDLFYILYIPLIIGTFLLLDKIKGNQFSRYISVITLELYGIQMIFGFKIATMIFQYVKIKLLSNIFTIVILIILSLGMHFIFNKIRRLK